MRDFVPFGLLKRVSLAVHHRRRWVSVGGWWERVFLGANFYSSSLDFSVYGSREVMKILSLEERGEKGGTGRGR